jgi:hypothetical protein
MLELGVYRRDRIEFEAALGALSAGIFGLFQ